VAEACRFGKDEGVRVEAKKELIIAEYNCCVGSAMRLAESGAGMSNLASRSRHRLGSLLVVFSLMVAAGIVYL